MSYMTKKEFLRERRERYASNSDLSYTERSPVSSASFNILDYSPRDRRCRSPSPRRRSPYPYRARDLQGEERHRSRSPNSCRRRWPWSPRSRRSSEPPDRWRIYYARSPVLEERVSSRHSRVSSLDTHSVIDLTGEQVIVPTPKQKQEGKANMSLAKPRSQFDVDARLQTPSARGSHPEQALERFREYAKQGHSKELANLMSHIDDLFSSMRDEHAEMWKQHNILLEKTGKAIGELQEAFQEFSNVLERKSKRQ